MRSTMCVAFQIKPAGQHCPVVLILLFQLVLSFESIDEILKRDHSNIATKQYFSEVPFVFRYFLK